MKLNMYLAKEVEEDQEKLGRRLSSMIYIITALFEK